MLLSIQYLYQACLFIAHIHTYLHELGGCNDMPEKTNVLRQKLMGSETAANTVSC